MWRHTCPAWYNIPGCSQLSVARSNEPEYGDIRTGSVHSFILMRPRQVSLTLINFICCKVSYVGIPDMDFCIKTSNIQMAAVDGTELAGCPPPDLSVNLITSRSITSLTPPPPDSRYWWIVINPTTLRWKCIKKILPPDLNKSKSEPQQSADTPRSPPKPFNIFIFVFEPNYKHGRFSIILLQKFIDILDDNVINSFYHIHFLHAPYLDCIYLYIVFVTKISETPLTLI